MQQEDLDMRRAVENSIGTVDHDEYRLEQEALLLDANSQMKQKALLSRLNGRTRFRLDLPPLPPPPPPKKPSNVLWWVGVVLALVLAMCFGYVMASPWAGTSSKVNLPQIGTVKKDRLVIRKA